MEAKLNKVNYFSRYIKSIESKSIDGYFPDSRAYFVSLIVDEETLFIHGGCNKKKDYSQIDVMDHKKTEWKMIQEISCVDPFFLFDKTLSGHTADLVKLKGNKNIIIYGGFDGKFYSNAIYLIETENFQFHQVDVRGDKNYNSKFPQQRAYHTSNFDEVENCLYIFGGWNGNINYLFDNNFLSLWKFDLYALMWEQISLENKSGSRISLRGHTSHLLKKSNIILIYGGVSGFSKFNDKIIQISLIVEGATPAGRAFHSSCFIEERNFLFIYGGILPNQEVSNEKIIFDITRKVFITIKNNMEILNDLSFPKLFGHKMIKIENKIMILGGLDDYSLLNEDPESEKGKDNTLLFDKRKAIFETDSIVNTMKNILIINLN